MTTSRRITSAPLPGMLVADRASEGSEYHVWRPAGTHDWLLFYTIGGGGRHGYAGGNNTSAAGDLVLLAPGTIHDYQTMREHAPWNFFWVHFQPRPHWAAWLHLPQPAPGISILHIDDETTRARLVNVFERLLTDSHSYGPYSDDLALAALEELLLVVARWRTRRESSQLDPRIEQVLALLATSLDAPLSIEELAASVALSASRLAHLFKAQAGDSIGRVHMQLRLRHAARLLAFSSRGVAEIAADVGFPSPFHFSHQFKRHYGQSPSAYRTTALTSAKV